MSDRSPHAEVINEAWFRWLIKRMGKPFETNQEAFIAGYLEAETDQAMAVQEALRLRAERVLEQAVIEQAIRIARHMSYLHCDYNEQLYEEQRDLTEKVDALLAQR